MFRNFNIVKQQDVKDCGVCCLLSIIRYYKSDFSLEQLREYTKTNKQGVSAYNLVETAKKLGFAACGLKGSIGNLSDKKIVLPAIAHITINNSYNHYVVIYKIDFKKEMLIIGDPIKGIMKYSFKDFNNIWSGVIIILYPVKKLLTFNRKNMKEYIIDLLKKYKKNIILLGLLSFVITIFSIINSFYFKIVIDNIIVTKSINNLIIISLLFFLLIIFKIIADLFRKKILLFINKEIDINMFFNIYKHIINLPYRYYKNRTTGEIVNRISDISYIRDIIGKIFLTVFIDSFMVIFAAIALFFINSTLFLISLFIAFIYFIIIISFSKVFDNYVVNSKNYEAEFTNYLIESINNYETIKGLNINEKIVSNGYIKYNRYIDQVYDFNNCYNFQSFLKDFINYFSVILILFIGSIFVINNQITLGDLITFNTLLIYFLEPIKNMIDLEMTIRYSKTIVKRVMELYDVNSEQLENNNVNNIEGNINVKNLNYSYNDQDLMLKKISLSICKGEKILLVGESGSGKSTLLKLLLKYYEVNNNMIFIDDIDINNYHINDIRNNICYISQNEKLFTDSIYNNIILDRNISNESFINICKLFKINQIYKNNPLCFDMLIEEDGFNISGGEKQRIIMARSILSNKNIYIFDESMNQVDIKLEREILVKLFNELKDKTIIMTCHRLNNKDLFDKVIYLNNGMINNQGVVYG